MRTVSPSTSRSRVRKLDSLFHTLHRDSDSSNDYHEQEDWNHSAECGADRQPHCRDCQGRQGRRRHWYVFALPPLPLLSLVVMTRSASLSLSLSCRPRDRSGGTHDFQGEGQEGQRIDDRVGTTTTLACPLLRSKRRLRASVTLSLSPVLRPSLRLPPFLPKKPLVKLVFGTKQPSFVSRIRCCLSLL